MHPSKKFSPPSKQFSPPSKKFSPPGKKSSPPLVLPSKVKKLSGKKTFHVAVIGKGALEHTYCWKLNQSPKVNFRGIGFFLRLFCNFTTYYF